MSLPHPTETTSECDMQEGSGYSDEVLGSMTRLSEPLNSVNFNNTSGGSRGNNDKGKGTSGGEKTNSGGRTTILLGVRKRGAAMKKKEPASAKIADALCRIADAIDIDVKAAERMAAEARVERMAAEARAYEFSILGVMSHLNQIPEIVYDNDFYTRCAHLMKDPAAREMFVAMKDMKDKLIMFLNLECYRHF